MYTDFGFVLGVLKISNGLNFGINDYGKSAPYKDVYNHFELNTENITKRIKEKL